MTTFCAIDFGTSNSAVARPTADGLRLAPVEGAHVTLPTAVFFNVDEHTREYGRAALDAYIDGFDGRLMRSMKSILGSPLAETTTDLGDGSAIRYTDVITIFLEHLKRRAEHFAGAPIARAVLGRPVFFVDDDPRADQLAQHQLEAAARAVEYVQNGMKVGLGSGSTSEAFINLLGARVRGGLDIIGVPTSERTAQLARSLGIALGNLNDLAPLDLDVDGADESDHNLDLIKGGGGALLREKIVAASAKKFIVMIHGPKLGDKMGAFPLPIEVLEFGHAETARRLKTVIVAQGYGDVPLKLRMKGDAVYRTDSNNVIYDAAFGPVIAETTKLATALSCVPGVVEHGLYIGIASTLIVARPESIEVIERK